MMAGVQGSAAHVNQPSFATGEISPTVFGRVDLAKYHSGLAQAENWFVDYRGGMSTRAGTMLAGRARLSSSVVRVIQFQFSTVQQYVLELGDFYMRFYVNGGQVLETALAITAATNASPGVFTHTAHGYANGDWVYLATFGGMTQVNGKTFIVAGVTANTFTLTDLNGVPVNTTAYGVYTTGGTSSRVYTLVTPWASADLALLKYTQSADVMTLTHKSYPTYNLNRFGQTNWTIVATTTGAVISPPAAAPTLATSTAGVASYMYVVTAVSSTGEESIASLPAVISSAVDVSATAGTITVTYLPVAGASYYKIYRSTISQSSPVPYNASVGFSGRSFGTTFKDSNIVPDFTQSPPQHANPFANGQVTGLTVTAAGTGYTAGTATVSITTGTGSGFDAIVVVVGGGVTGFLVRNAGTGYLAGDTVVIAGGTGATATATFSANSGNNPGCVTYFQQRRVFGNTLNKPQTLNGSKVGNFTNFDKAIPTVASDAFEFELASQQVNDIKSMRAMPGGLVVFTGGGVWQIAGGGTNTPLTALNAIANPQAYVGASDVPAIPINYNLLYVTIDGDSVRDLSYNVFANIYLSDDKSILANHLFTDYSIIQWEYAETPYRVIWAIRSDGTLLSFTYVKDQDIYGWARHTTQGLFESITVVKENRLDVAYFVVRRYIGGQWIRFIERMVPRALSANVENSWCVDCGLDYPLVYPVANLTPTAASGLSVVFNADAAVFTSGMIGYVIRAGGGIGTIVTYNSTTQVVVKLTTPISAVIPQQSTLVPLVQPSGNWSCTPTTKTVTGLDHLEGQTVKVLADGNVAPDQVVTNGSVTIPHACSRIIIGLGYDCTLQTLPLDVGDPTIQGKLKKVQAVTLKVVSSRGLKIGPTLDSLVEFKERTTQQYGQPIQLITDVERKIIPPTWGYQGQFYIYQSYPLPATVLSVTPEVFVGSS